MYAFKLRRMLGTFFRLGKTGRNTVQAGLWEVIFIVFVACPNHIRCAIKCMTIECDERNTTQIMENTGLAPTPHFAAELVDLVIDHNHADVQALQSSALVSRQWTPSSRRHLFTDVNITHDNAREFIQLLASPSCTFSSAIRRLTINFVPGSQRWFGEFSRRLSSNDQVKVSGLRIQGPAQTIIRDEVFAALSMHFNQVKELNFGPVIIQSFSQFSAFLCSFQALETLSCSCIFQNNVYPSSIQASPPLRQVNLEFPSTNVVLEFLHRQNILPSIVALSLSYLKPENLPILANYLAVSNDYLQTVAIFIDSRVPEAVMDEFVAALDFSRLHALRDLRIETTPLLSPSQAYQLVSRVNSVQFRYLEISVALFQGIARLDILLSGNQHTSLKVKIIGSTWADIRQALPRCDMKNILRSN